MAWPMSSPWRAGRSRIILLTALATLAIAAAACNPATGPTTSPSTAASAAASVASASASTRTGVGGIVLAGPTCPVERVGASPCVRPVSGATILAEDQSGREVGRATTDATGAYFLPLAPGTYRIVPQPVGGLMGVAPAQNVTVTAGAPVELNLEYDTGIR
jgi:Carboxypeptidase regulatory-like domain